MATYKSTHTGGQVDTAVNQLLTNSAKVQYGNIIGTLANQTDLKAALDAKEAVSNKVQTVTSAGTTTQYPSAKAVYNKMLDKVSFMDLGTTTEIDV